MDGTENEYEDEDQSMTQHVTNILLLPLRIATSPLLLRTYLRTVLLFLTSTIFFGFAVVAYSSFYYSYIPIRGISVPVYLQYDHGTSSPLSPCLTTPLDSGIVGGKSGKWPYGIANTPGLVDRQKYDVTVEMDVPRSDTNLGVGNWMVGLEMRGPPAAGAGGMSLLGWEEEWYSDESGPGGGAAATTTTKATSSAPGGSRDKVAVLARSRRPALLTYRSRVIEMAHRFLRLPFYLAGWHTESEHIEISMLESVVFEQGPRKTPSSLRLELRSRQPLEVYGVKVRITARLEGLRWLMYRFWITSAAVGICAFWSVEMAVLLFTWGLFTLLFSSGGRSPAPPKPSIKPESEPAHSNTDNKSDVKVKLEPPDDDPETPFSDTSRTFPTLSSQPPLSYHAPTSDPPQDAHLLAALSTPATHDIEADDEEDDFVLDDALPRLVKRESAFEDSGLGTSLESGMERDAGMVVRRRSGRGGEARKRRSSSASSTASGGETA